MAQQARSLGKYRLIALLAQGGMGDVWLAVSRGPAGFSKLVVVKELRSTFVEDASFLTMFMEEARLSARLNHPNVVQTYEVGEDNGSYFIAMEYLDGQSLQRLRRRSRERGATHALALELPVVLGVLRALEYAHAFEDYDGTPLHIVHRDVSPHNVIVTYDGQVKLLDFGIAKTLDNAEETRAGTVKGKMAYMSPEQAVAKDVDHRTDIFATGVILAEAILGERYWPRIPQAEIYEHLLNRQLPTLRDRVGAVPEDLLSVCERALACDRDARYQSAVEMRAALEAVIAANSGLRCAPDATSTTAAELFAAERASVRAAVDAHLRATEAAERAERAQEASVELASLEPDGAEALSGPTFPVADSASHPVPSSLVPVTSAKEEEPLPTPPAFVGDYDVVVRPASSYARFVPAALVVTSAFLIFGLYLARARNAEPRVAPATSWPSVPTGTEAPAALANAPADPPRRVEPMPSPTTLEPPADSARPPAKPTASPRAATPWAPRSAPTPSASAAPKARQADLEIRFSR